MEVTGAGERECLHPQEQVGGYVEYLRDFNRWLGERPGVGGLCLLAPRRLGQHRGRSYADRGTAWLMDALAS